MPKPITIEMLHAMSLDQRKTLQRNAMALDTPAAHAVLELLSHEDLKPVAPPTVKKVARPKAAKPATAKTKSAAPKSAGAKKATKTASARGADKAAAAAQA